MRTKAESKMKKNIVVVCITLSSVVLAMVALLYPMVSVQRTVLITTTRSLQYSSEVIYPYYTNENYGYYVNVTNRDTTGGIFTVTINYLNINGQLVDRLTKSLFIGSGETKKFAPEGMADSYSYTVSAPSVQDSHYESQTEYESVLNYLIGK